MKKSYVLAAILTFAGSVATAQSRNYLSYTSAADGVAACVDMAQSGGAGVAITVIDTANQTIVTARLDNVLPAAFEASEMKAYTALNFFQNSGDVAAILDQTPNFKDIPGLLAVPGGQPIFGPSGSIIGAIGVAGFPSPNDDAACAARAVETIG